MIFSNPIDTQPGFNGQAGQFDLWMNPGSHIVAKQDALHTYRPDQIVRYVPTGRLTGPIPPQMTLNITWDDLLPTDLTQLTFFKDILLFRDPIRQAIPTVPSWDIPTIDSPFPTLVYTSPHWMTETFQTDNILDLKWFLAYTDTAGYATASFDAMPTQSTLRIEPFDAVDSQWLDANPSDIDINHPTGQGWVLFLMKRELVLTSSDPPTLSFFEVNNPFGVSIPIPVQDPAINVLHHIYGGWQLLPTTTIQPTPPLPSLSPTSLFTATPPPRRSAGHQTIFNPLIQSEWQIFRNPLGLPTHRLFLQPQN